MEFNIYELRITDSEPFSINKFTYSDIDQALRTFYTHIIKTLSDLSNNIKFDYNLTIKNTEFNQSIDPISFSFPGSEGNRESCTVHCGFIIETDEHSVCYKKLQALSKDVIDTISKQLSISIDPYSLNNRSVDIPIEHLSQTLQNAISP